MNVHVLVGQVSESWTCDDNTRHSWTRYDCLHHPGRTVGRLSLILSRSNVFQYQCASKAQSIRVDSLRKKRVAFLVNTFALEARGRPTGQ